jgi:hypothetical protein
MKIKSKGLKGRNHFGRKDERNSGSGAENQRGQKEQKREREILKSENNGQ